MHLHNRKILIFVAVYFLCHGIAICASNTIDLFPELIELKSDELTNDVQEKIHGAFIKSIKHNDNSYLLYIKKELHREYELSNYWSAYLHYYLSLYHYKKGDTEISEKEIDLGIELLDSISDKSSEDYSLLALLYGFSIQFKEGKAVSIIGKVKRNYRKAIALDSTNIRAYYAFASIEFHMPEKFGGGKETEKYLFKALSINPEKKEGFPYWGKEESYELLIKWYIKKELIEKAKEYYSKATMEFPKSFRINQLENILENN